MSPPVSRVLFRRRLFWSLFLFVLTFLTLAALLVPWYLRITTPSLKVGQVATEDILAPTTITFNSQVLTIQKRDAEEKRITPVYTYPEPAIARQQLEYLRAALAYMTNVRADTYATIEQKLVDLAALEKVHLQQETARTILSFSESHWQAVQQESIVVLEQVMRNTIRDNRMEETRATIPTLVSLSLPEDQADIVVDMVSAFVVPNSLYSESLTNEARQQARAAVTAVQRTFIAGQTVVSRGKVLAAEDIEALQNLGLARPQPRWQDPAGGLALVLLSLAFCTLYVSRVPSLSENISSLALASGLFLLFLTSFRLLTTGHTITPYTFPLAAFSLVMAALFGTNLAMITSVPLAIMGAYAMNNALDLTLYHGLSMLFGVLVLGRARRVTDFFWAGITVALTGSGIILAYRLIDPATDWVGVGTLVAASFFNGLASASLTVVLQYFLAQLLGITSPMQLIELTRPDHPLLHRILHDAPGTYQHSLQVSNLAEQAAERIGADPLLIRVGALYHDVGKTVNPMFFIENQMPGFLNPHDDLDPVTSAATIIRHVPDGLALARRYRLPRRILDFISEHHGTMLTRYQYVNAVKAAGGDEALVDMEKFRYPGPRPQSRETAILMLADGSEARVRAERPKDEAELRRLIRNVIDNRIASGQLDCTNLTLRDLDRICDSFTATLRGIYHPRVQYPQLDPPQNTPQFEAVATTSVPAAPPASIDSSQSAS